MAAQARIVVGVSDQSSKDVRVADTIEIHTRRAADIAFNFNVIEDSKTTFRKLGRRAAWRQSRPCDSKIQAIIERVVFGKAASRLKISIHRRTARPKKPQNRGALVNRKRCFSKFSSGSKTIDKANFFDAA